MPNIPIENASSSTESNVHHTHKYIHGLMAIFLVDLDLLVAPLILVLFASFLDRPKLYISDVNPCP